jgi:hypothetical protein
MTVAPRPPVHIFVPTAPLARGRVRLNPPLPQSVRLNPPARACVRPSPQAREFVRVNLPAPQCVRLNQPGLVFVRLSQPLLRFVRLSPPVQVAVPQEIRAAKPLPPGLKNLKKPLGVRKNRSSSSPAVA